MNFYPLVGNTALKERLSILYKSGRLPHAMILEGPSGSGRGTLARIIAQTVVCRGDGEKPCGECIPCGKAAGSYHPDVIEKSGGSGSNSFSVDAVRTVRSDAFILPNEADTKVYILKEVQTMSDSAQNALLKILEEPPAYVMFILTCDSASSLLPTILSRATVFSMGIVDEQDALSVLRERFPKQSEDSLRRVVAMSGGNIGRMIGGLSGGIFEEASALACRIAEAVTAQTELKLLSLCAGLSGNREKTRAVLGTLLLLFRDACMCRGGFDERLSGDRDILEKLRSRLTQAQLLSMIDIVERAQSALDRGANQALLTTWISAGLRDCVERRHS